MKSRSNVEDQLAALDEIPVERAERSARLRAALSAVHYRVLGKAARLAEEGLFYELEAALLQAYARLADKPAKQDPSCIAKKAIARALVALDCAAVDFYLRGLACRQLEPVWGGTRDTAAEVRSTCAMGLVATGSPRALVQLATLLHDPEAEARIGAARAIACGNPREAELLLRGKALAGDSEPAVLGECFSGLLSVEPEDSVPFVEGYLGAADEATREFAALALGQSRLDAALSPLQEAWESASHSPEFRRALLRAIAAHRSAAAFDWLIELVAEAHANVVAEIVEALAIYKHNVPLAERLESKLAQRSEPALLEEFRTLWSVG